MVSTLALVGVLLIWICAARWALPDKASSSSSSLTQADSRRLSPRNANIHRSNKEWAANFAGGIKTVPLLPDGDSTAGAHARSALASLQELKADDVNQATTLMLQRLDAFDRVLQADNELRRRWNARLSSDASRGIAITAGGASALANAFPVIYTLVKKIKTSLPIAVMHVGAEEVGPTARALFEQHLPDVKFFDLLANGMYPEHHIPLRVALKATSDPKAIGYLVCYGMHISIYTQSTHTTTHKRRQK